MHEGVDYLYEAVINSIEAGADDIIIEYKDCKSYVEVTVKDNGKEEELSSSFKKGESRKKGHSGLALYQLKERTEGQVTLDRKKGITILSYSMVKDKNYGSLFSIVPLIFDYLGKDEHLEFIYISRSKTEILDSKDLYGLGIMKIRALVQNWD